MVGNFEIEGIIWVGKGWVTSPADQQFNLGRGGGPCGAARKQTIVEIGAGGHD